MSEKKRIGLCAKCEHAKTVPGKMVNGVRGRELVGCMLSSNPDHGNKCPLVPGMHNVTKATWVGDSFSLVLTTTFQGKDKLPRCMMVTGIDSLETAQAMVKHLGFDLECREI